MLGIYNRMKFYKLELPHKYPGVLNYVTSRFSEIIKLFLQTNSLALFILSEALSWHTALTYQMWLVVSKSAYHRKDIYP